MATRTAEAKHQADRGPSREEADMAERTQDEMQRSGEDRSVAEHYEEMARKGVDQKGEGKIE